MDSKQGAEQSPYYKGKKLATRPRTTKGDAGRGQGPLISRVPGLRAGVGVGVFLNMTLTSFLNFVRQPASDIIPKCRHIEDSGYRWARALFSVHSSTDLCSSATFHWFQSNSPFFPSLKKKFLFCSSCLSGTTSSNFRFASL